MLQQGKIRLDYLIKKLSELKYLYTPTHVSLITPDNGDVL